MLKDPKTRLHLAADEAAKFVKETGCDSLACAIGTSTKTRNFVQPGSWPKFVRPCTRRKGQGSLVHRFAYNGDVAALKAA